jgi:superoxide dismutase, Fe-Mn family
MFVGEPRNRRGALGVLAAAPGLVLELRMRTLLATAGAAVASDVMAAPAAPAAGKFTLPPLPYPETALAPTIDAETMGLHHGKHHQTYVDNLNKAIADAPAAQGKSLEALFPVISTLPPAIRNNGGGHWNHSFFWETMAPEGNDGAPSPALAAAIGKAFGSVADLQKAFDEAGTKRFGSGWAWLIRKADGSVAITSTPNQDNPLMDVAEARGTPLLVNDLWEHAYYLTYRNKRGDYLKSWWKVVNWNAVNARFAA